jgi:SNF2 family DNA or RNA helicase
VFVSNPQAGATGLTLTQAQTVIYYSNSFKLVDRLQSEDRAHRIGQEHPVNYIDLVAGGTVDEKIVRSLRDKWDVAAQITGDELKDWL